MQSFSVFGSRMADEYKNKVTVRNTAAFQSWRRHTYGDAVHETDESIISVPIEHWVNAFQEGKAPRVCPNMTDMHLLQWVPMNIVSLYFV